MSYLMFDAANPPAQAPAGYVAAAGYIGGDTPHVWTAAEWGRFKGLRKLPVYVRSNPQNTTQAEADAFAALHQLYALGAPSHIPVALDLETAVNPGYVTAFGKVMGWAGFRVWVYGSASSVFGNPPLSGYWVADYAGRGPFMYGHPKVRATQYANGTAYDSSLLKTWQYLAGGLWK